MNKIYIAIDLKSFYASVECMERRLDPLTTHLVVADKERSEKTICLAVSPSLKAYGIGGRARLFEVIQRINEVNSRRKEKLGGAEFVGKSCNALQLKNNPALAVDFVIAPPQMARYISFSTDIYNIYCRHVSPDDIHVYSIDEVFIDATAYLRRYKLSAYELAKRMIRDVLQSTGITATAGIGTNLFLSKVAMDIVAKHTPPDSDGVRIAELNEEQFRRQLWSHEPLTDFWRVGRGYAQKLEMYGIRTMGDIARCSIKHEDFLYKLFGVNAELLIDHAWGWEPCTIRDIKAYKPETNSLGTGQVLSEPYSAQMARKVIYEMADYLSLDLTDKHLVTNQLVLTIGYDVSNVETAQNLQGYQGEITIDAYGRKIPKASHGSINLQDATSSTKLMVQAALELFDRIVREKLLIRRLNLTAAHVVSQNSLPHKESKPIQLNLFEDFQKKEEEVKQRQEEQIKEKRMQRAVLEIKKKFGKNAILKGISLEEGATAKERNRQIGGHRA